MLLSLGPVEVRGPSYSHWKLQLGRTVILGNLLHRSQSGPMQCGRAANDDLQRQFSNFLVLGHFYTPEIYGGLFITSEITTENFKGS